MGPGEGLAECGPLVFGDFWLGKRNLTHYMMDGVRYMRGAWCVVAIHSLLRGEYAGTSTKAPIIWMPS